MVGDKIKENKYIRYYKISELLIISLAIICITITFLIQLTWPIEADLGFYSLTGMMILEGYKPYTEIWLMKGPLIPYFYALIIQIFGNVEWAIHLVDIFISLLGLIAIWYIIKKISNRFCAFVIAISLMANYHTSILFAAQPDSWVTMLIAIMVALIIYDEGKLKKSTAVFSGIIIALVTSIKLPYIIYYIIPSLYAIIYYKNNKKLATRFVIISLHATILLILLSFLWLSYISSLSEMFDIIFGYIPDSHLQATTTPLTLLYGYSNLLTENNGLLYILIMSAFGSVSLFSSNKKEFLTILAWAIIALVLILIQNKIAEIYSSHLLPTIYIFAAYFLYKVKKPLLYFVSIFILAVTFSGHFINKAPEAFKFIAKHITADEYSDQFSYSFYEDGYKNILEISNYIKQNIELGNTIYSTDYILTINLLSNTISATKFANIFPLIFAKGERRKRYEKELEKDLLTNKPQFIIYPYIANLKGEAFKKTSYLTETTRRIMHSHYNVDKVIDNFVIFKRHEQNICFEEYDYSLFLIFRFMLSHNK